MNEKELREIKRRFRPERTNVPRIVGCFVNENKQIIAKINQSLGLEESIVSEKLLATMKKVLSGSIGTNLTDVPFSTKQVTDSEEHKLLMGLVKSSLRDEALLDRFFAAAIESVKCEGNFVILLANDIYDVPSYSKDGERGESSSMHSYIVAAVCPVKSLPEVLSFRESDSLFHAMSATGLLGAPEVGFTFPTFEGRRTNIYNALYYTRSLSDNQPEFMKRILAAEAGMPPKAQGAAFSDCLSEVLAEECSFEVVRSVHTQVAEMVEAHKEAKEEEPLLITGPIVKEILENCGVDEEKVEAATRRFDETFGQGAELAPKNIVAVRKFEVKTPDVSIKVSPEHRDVVSTQVIGGTKYVMIRVTGPVEVNGINIEIED